jgi:hypothetical protein
VSPLDHALKSEEEVIALALPLLLMFPSPVHLDSRSSLDLESWIGRYAMELRVASTARLPLLPADRTTTVSLLLVDLRVAAGAGTLIQRHQVCAVRIDGSSSVRMQVPDAFVHALSSREYPAEFARSSSGWEYAADMGPDAIGFDPARTGGELPRSAVDEGVNDADGDGEPGATVEMHVPAFGRVQLFIAQRSRLVLRSVEVDGVGIRGGVEIRMLEQRTLGARPAFFGRTPRLTPDPERSSFNLVRVAESTDCEGVRNQATTFFAESFPSRRQQGSHWSRTRGG